MGQWTGDRAENSWQREFRGMLCYNKWIHDISLVFFGGNGLQLREVWKQSPTLGQNSDIQNALLVEAKGRFICYRIKFSKVEWEDQWTKIWEFKAGKSEMWGKWGRGTYLAVGLHSEIKCLFCREWVSESGEIIFELLSASEIKSLNQHSGGPRLSVTCKTFKCLDSLSDFEGQILPLEPGNWYFCICR